ncbi:MAG: hypothetical protein AAGI63_08240 [Planctomycetota bacterium]
MLTPTIIEYCRRCTPNERKSIVAFCCHLVFTDRSVLRREVEFAQAVAEEMGISSDDVVRMAHKARRRRLKIKKPKSSDARILMFHLALLASAVDRRIDVREREAIERLAKQLRISQEIVDERFEKLTSTRAADVDVKANQAGGSLDEAVESLSHDWVAEDLEAILYEHRDASQETDFGDIQFSRSEDGRIELSIDFQNVDVSADKVVSVVLKDTVICKWLIVRADLQHVIRGESHDSIPTLTAGDTIEVRLQGERWLVGTFV